jgi:hypothetical protein
MIMNKQKLSNPVVLALLFLVCLPTLFPILAAPLTTLPYPDNGDVKLSLTILHSNLTKIARLQWNQIYHLPILYPLSYTMTAGINLFGQTVFFLPLYLLGLRNPYLLYNIAVLVTFVLAGFGAFHFFKEALQNRSASLAGAILYILLPFRVHNIPHLNILFHFPIPFGFFFLLRFLKQKRKRDLLWTSFFLLLQFSFDLSLGIYFSLSLGLFFLIFWAVFRNLRFRDIAGLAAAMLAVLLILVVLFSPYLNKQTSYSFLTGEFKATKYLPSSSFYVNWSFLQLLAGRISWEAFPQFPGFVPAFLFLLAFWPFLGRKSERATFGLASLTLILPAVGAIVFSGSLSLPPATAYMDVSLFLFLASAAVLVGLLRKKLPPVIKAAAVFYIAFLFVSFRPFSAILNFFNLLAAVLPFISRLRGIHRPYIFQLFFALLASYGFIRYSELVRRKKRLIILLIVLMLIEKWRWPITTGRLTEDRADLKNLYQKLSEYPLHYGLLELPLLDPFSNTYTYCTRYHGQHTCHGGLGLVTDVLGLRRLPSLSVRRFFAGLADPATIGKLRQEGIRILLVSRSILEVNAAGMTGETSHTRKFILEKIKESIAKGEENGLYERVEDYPEGTILLINGAETGRNIRHFIPYYALISPRRMKLKIEAGQPTRTALFFNRNFLRDYPLEPGVTEISLEIKRLSPQPQFNYLNLKSESAVTLREVDFSAD